MFILHDQKKLCLVTTQGSHWPG